MKINQEDNNKILMLLRNKLSPLHSKIKFFPNLTIKPKQSIQKQKPIDPLLLTIKATNYPQDRNIDLIRKARNHLAEKKHVSHHQGGGLQAFIQLFGKQNYASNASFTYELNQLRNTSPSWNNIRNIFDHDCQAIQIAEEYGQFSPEQISILNAKLRRKLNHTKIVQLSKKM